MASLETAPAQPLTRGAVCLMILGPEGHSLHQIPGRETTVGRAPNNDLVILEPSISRNHCRLVRSEEGFSIVDLGSANGVWVNEQRLEPETAHPLRLGEPIRLGDVLVVLQRQLVAAPPVAGERMPDVVVEDDAMRRLYDTVDQVGSSDLPILITGETGVGKELIAKAIHQNSPRQSGRFVGINCGALPAGLVESELFGHVRGSFTGAAQDKVGLVESAHGGTLFLDEIGDLPTEHQVRLLRVLEEKKVRPVGAVKARSVDLRLVAATHRDLQVEVEAGRFRQDLLFRLNAVLLHVPPLRERSRDLLPLVEHFAFALARRLERPPPVVSADVLSVLREYDWPGNVRQLRNVIERAVVLAADGAVTIEHLPDEVLRPAARRPAPPPLEAKPVTAETTTAEHHRPAASTASTVPPSGFAGGGAPNALWDEVSELEKQRILRTLEECAGNQTRAARKLGISRRTLINRLEKYGIPRPIKGKP